jgi:hypothetical protein
VTVDIVQFIAPHGEQRVRQTEVPDDCAVGYEALRRKNCRLTAEVLMGGQISMCIEHGEGDVAIEVCDNGPSVLKHLADMIRKFDGAEFDAWLAKLNDSEVR